MTGYAYKNINDTSSTSTMSPTLVYHIVSPLKTFKMVFLGSANSGWKIVEVLEFVVFPTTLSTSKPNHFH